LAFRRPYIFENRVSLPENIGVAHHIRPSIINDVSKMDREFQNAVAEAFGLRVPDSLGGMDQVNPQRARRSYLQSMDSHLENIISRERTWVIALFSHMYSRLFNALDLETLEETEVKLTEMHTSLKEATKAAREFKEQVAAAYVIPSEQENAIVPVEQKDPKLEVYKREKAEIRLKKNYFRGLIQSIKQRGDAIARLVFVPDASQKDIATLDFIATTLIDRGLLKSPKSLAPIVERTCGIRIDELVTEFPQQQQQAQPQPKQQQKSKKRPREEESDEEKEKTKQKKQKKD